MNEGEYGEYVAAFNGRDYRRLHDFFADDVQLISHGNTLHGKAGIAAFYDFFHQHVGEQVVLKQFWECGPTSIANVDIRFEGLTPFRQEDLDQHGFSRMAPLPPGTVLTLEYFIVYESRPDTGKIWRIRAAVFEP